MLFSRTYALSLVAALSSTAQAQYALDTTYDASNFFQEFSFFTDSDPTHGHVQYVDSATAKSMGLIGERDGAAFFGADSTETNPANGRKSVRLTSNKVFTHGLVIGDFAHMPAAKCGSWPAFWTVAPNNWPGQGEIDIIEGVNTQSSTSVTLHTGPGCTISNEGTDPSSTLLNPDCNAGDAYTGCSTTTTNTQNYGDGFNSNGGGVYAMEWTSSAIAVWFFPRSGIPSDIASGNPNPSSWAQPIARFAGGSGCTIDNSFQGHSVVFTNTFCGDWAGQADVWNNNPTCSAQGSCVDYVNNNPTAFQDSYWLVNSVKVYQQANGRNFTMTRRTFRA